MERVGKESLLSYPELAIGEGGYWIDGGGCRDLGYDVAVGADIQTQPALLADAECRAFDLLSSKSWMAPPRRTSSRESLCNGGRWSG